MRSSAPAPVDDARERRPCGDQAIIAAVDLAILHYRA
jgi:hypothetical protein